MTDVLTLTDTEARAALMMLQDKMPGLAEETITSVLAITRKGA
jgi:hypothetical protein